MKKKIAQPPATKLKGIESDNNYDDAGEVRSKTKTGQKKIEDQAKKAQDVARKSDIANQVNDVIKKQS